MPRNKDNTEAIEQLIRETPLCSRGHDCCKSDCGDIPKGILIDKGEAVKCLEERAKTCNYSIPYGGSYFCSCQIRKYIARKFVISGNERE